MEAIPLATVTTATVKGPAGGIILLTTMTPAKWTFDTIGRLGTIMFDLAGQACGC
jgi:hypothetical protein